MSACEACQRGDCPRCDIWTCGCGHEGVSEALSAAYDDWPITAVRMDGMWRAVGIPDDRSSGDERRTDAEVEEWIADEAAEVKIRQDHYWEYEPSPPGTLSDPKVCILCGLVFADLTDEEKKLV